MKYEEDYDIIYKIILIGNSGVGKTNIFSKYLKNEFHLDTKATVGVEFGAKKIELNGLKIKAQIWDTAGQERYRSVTNAYYKGCKGAMVVYDITNKESFDSVDKWVVELRQNSDENIFIVLIGNKIDLATERIVTQREVESKSRALDIPFLETSACSGANIEQCFDTMIREIHKKNPRTQFEENIDEYYFVQRKSLLENSKERQYQNINEVKKSNSNSFICCK